MSLTSGHSSLKTPNPLGPPFALERSSKFPWRLDWCKANDVEHRHVKSGYLPQFEELKKLVEPKEVKNIKMTLAAPEWYVHLRFGIATS